MLFMIFKNIYLIKFNKILNFVTISVHMYVVSLKTGHTLFLASWIKLLAVMLRFF